MNRGQTSSIYEAKQVMIEEVNVNRTGINVLYKCDTPQLSMKTYEHDDNSASSLAMLSCLETVS